MQPSLLASTAVLLTAVLPALAAGADPFASGPDPVASGSDPVASGRPEPAPPRAEPAGAATLLESWSASGFAPVLGAAAPQSGGMRQIHPPLFVALGVGFGTQNFEINTGTGTFGDSAGAVLGNLQVEYFFDSQLGVYLRAEGGESEDLGDLTDAKVETQQFHLGLSYRATVDDDFRMPVRLGIYSHRAELSGSAFVGGDPEYSNLGLKLSAEPEFILSQTLSGERMSELTAFLEVGVGAGPTTVENDTDEEEGFAFQLGAELGARYRFMNGLFLGLSVLGRKQNYGATDSFDNAVFFGTDDDLLAAVLTFGIRR